jgi:formimidoylglutamate deiminase
MPENAGISQHRLRCEQLFDGVHWHSPGYIEICNGTLVSVGPHPLASLTQQLAGITLPGMPNLHSHAFQRALAGLTEQRSHSTRQTPARDSFWSWRELMYRFVARLEPDDVQAITEQAYVEMLECGYTSVAEFHYLHHTPTGKPYADLAELSRRVTAAARGVGMRMTLLPVYYEAAGFGSMPIADNQRRFYNTRERFLDLVAQLDEEQDSLISLGVAPHSLRAVPLDGLADVVRAVSATRPTSVIHMHIAEQRREVEECLAHHGLRPVELLFREQAIDARWCLVHATHLSAREIAMLATSDAVAGLCPSTWTLGDRQRQSGHDQCHGRATSA